jgi:tRNA(fMet)-specific endonuclease VapC
MPSRFLLDTDILSDLVRKPHGEVAKAIARVGEQNVCTSIVVAAELRFGAAKSGSKRLVRQVDRILSALEILPLEPPADRQYASVRNLLERRGHPIGPNDLLIAAQSLAENCTLVTANEREFSRVPSLKTENWLST